MAEGVSGRRVMSGKDDITTSPQLVERITVSFILGHH